VTTAPNARPGAETVEQHTSLALIALFAMGVIVAINMLARPQRGPADSRLLSASGCRQCGTVVAVRHSAHSVPLTYVEVQMRDGSLRTVRGPGQGVSIGDVVEIRDDALTPRDAF